MSLDDIRREIDEMGPDYPEAFVALVDALRDYIRAEDNIGLELLQEGVITREQFEAADPITNSIKALLTALEAHEIDPSLHGIRRWKP